MFLMSLALNGCAKNPEAIANASNTEFIAKDSDIAKEQTPIIPLGDFFSDPSHAFPQISPDGIHIAYLAPVEGISNIWVASRKNPSDKKALTNVKGSGLFQYEWAYDNKTILFLKDNDGDEQYGLFSVNSETKEIAKLLVDKKAAVRIEKLSPRHPTEIMVSINNRNPAQFDLYRIDLETGSSELAYENKKFGRLFLDDDFKILAAFNMTGEGGYEYLRFDENENDWVSFFKAGMADMTNREIALKGGIKSFDKEGKTAFTIGCRGRDTVSLTSIELKTGVEELLASDPKADITRVMTNRQTGAPQAVAIRYDRLNWVVLDKELEKDFAELKKVKRGDFIPYSRSLDDRFWIVQYTSDNEPIKYYLYERDSRKAGLLFSYNDALDKLPLGKTHSAVIKSRDGLDLVCYYSLPVWNDKNGYPDKPLPMVLMVHGGPYERDTWGYDPWNQWLVNRGYAVLQVNYRGSSGFGKKFLNASRHEWAGKMHADLIDAVNWTVENGISDREKIAIMGISYGGYAAMVGLAFTPDTFACGVSLAGVSNLVMFLEGFPVSWGITQWLYGQIGDPRTEEGRKFLADRSPVTHADRIKRPLLIAQGAKDPEAHKSQADLIAETMEKNAAPLLYLLYADEGHGIDKPVNRLSFFSITELFLTECIGGRSLPLDLDAIKNSSLEVKAGRDMIKGLQIVDSRAKP